MINKKDKLSGINMFVFMSYFTKLGIFLIDSAEKSLPFMIMYEIITSRPCMPG